MASWLDGKYGEGRYDYAHYDTGADEITSDYTIYATKREITSDYYIKKEYTETAFQNAYIKGRESNTIDSDYYIQKSYSLSITSDARIKVEGQEGSISSDGIIKQIYNQQISQDAQIFDSDQLFILSNYYISKIVTETITQDANITATSSENITSDGFILSTTGVSISSDAEIRGTTFTIFSDYSIKTTYVDTISADAYISVEKQNFINSDYYLKSTFSNAILSDYFVKVLGDEGSITTNSSIETTTEQAITSDYSIKATNLTTITSDGYIVYTYDGSIASDYYIVRLGIPVLISPADGSTDLTYPPVFTWQCPNPADVLSRNVHFTVQFATDAAFTNILKENSTFNPGADMVFEAYLGGSWVPFPSAGLTLAQYGSNVRVTVDNIQGGLKYWRVKCCIIS